MTQANKGDGWTLDISEARSGGTGPESNRDKARRGGWGTGEVLSVGAARGSVMTVIHRREDGALVVSGSDGVDRVTAPGEIRTPEDADRLFGVGFGLGRWMRENAGAAVLDVVPVKVEQPDPAPGQVWLPPVGACPKRWADEDGTLTVLRTEEGSARFTNGCVGNIESMTAPASDWTCIGVATPHGRVMVGDGFQTGAGYPVTISAVSPNPASVIVRWADGGEVCNRAEAIVDWTRTRYAPARAGERYRWRATGDVETVETGPDGTLQTRSGYGVRPMRGLRGVSGAAPSFDPAQWERLDVPPARPHANLPTPRALRPDESAPPASCALHVEAAPTDDVDARVRTVADYTARTARVAIPITQAMREQAAQTIAVRNGAPSTLTLAAPAPDLRALFDAIGRALESAAPEVVTFDGKPLSVLRSDACAEPSVHGGAIDANARDLCVLRASVAQALADGRSCICQWGKGRTLTVERVGGPLVMVQTDPAEPQATHYDGAQGGPDAWRWEVGE